MNNTEKDTPSDQALGFHMDNYFSFTMQRALHDIQSEERLVPEGIELYEESIGKEQVEKDYQMALQFWKEMETERLENIKQMSEIDNEVSELIQNSGFDNER